MGALSKIEISERRKAAWKTRRAKYGDRGHAGGHLRAGESERFAAMLGLIIKLHVEAVLSEGQVARATGLHRIRIRELADAEAARRDERLYLAAMRAEYGPPAPSSPDGRA